MGLVYGIYCLFDPAQNYMRRHSDARSRPKPARGSSGRASAASLASLGQESHVVSPISYPSPEQIETWDRQTREHVATLKAAQAETARTRGPQVRSSAQEVLDSGATSIEIDSGIVTARLTRFWNGKAVFETNHVGPGCSGRSMAEVPRSQPDSSLVEMIEKELVRSVAELEVDTARLRDMNSLD